MAVAADVLTAGAASVAALLSGVNLYVSGRREEQRWNREALIEAFVTFVGASFATGTSIDPDAVARLLWLPTAYKQERAAPPGGPSGARPH
jgi:hypothetical protein